MSTLAQLLMGTRGDVYRLGEYVAAEGGYFFGIMTQADGDYAYFLAGVAAEQNLLWCADSQKNNIVGAYSALNGVENTAKCVAKGPVWYAANYCANYRGGGHADWFLWARKEAELAGRNLGPVNHGSTATNYGAIPEAVPPFASYAVEPQQLASDPAFQAGGAQALKSNTYWCSGIESSTTCHAMDFSTGINQFASKSLTTYLVRPVRRVRLTTRSRQAVYGNILTGPVSFTVPDGVTSISVLVVDGGKSGEKGGDGSYGQGGLGGVGGARGQARYLNNIAVTPGQVITGYVAPADSTTQTTFGAFTGWQTVTPSGPSTGQSGSPGTESGPGSDGAGVTGIDLINPATPARYGITWPGGGGGGGGGGPNPGYTGARPPGNPGSPGAQGGIRIIWPGDRRRFPSTDTIDEFEV